MSQEPSPNFAYLAHHDPRLAALGTQAEEHFAGDPEVSLFKLRKFGELLAQRAAAKIRMYVDGRESQIDLVNRLHDAGAVNATQRALFHDLRRSGNAAVHHFEAVPHSEALLQLKVARELAVWFQRSFGNNRKFDPGPFVPPADPKTRAESTRAESTQAESTQAELTRLRQVAAAHAAEANAGKAEIEKLRQQAEEEAQRRLSAEERATRAAEDRAIWEALAAEQSEQSAAESAKLRAALAEQDTKLFAELAAEQSHAESQPPQAIQQRIEQSAEASEAIVLDEAAARRLIDKQLRVAGWEVDSDEMTFAKGVRPIKGKNLAIAEWPGGVEDQRRSRVQDIRGA